MFLSRFPNCAAAKIRICTIPSRYRGCTVLTSLRQLAEIMGMKLGELIFFCFTDPLLNDVVRIGKEGEGIDVTDGYSPYQQDFQMVERTAYSVTANPTLFFWIHVIGCFLGEERRTEPGTSCHDSGTLPSMPAGLHRGNMML
ncbi:hypothetical protein JTE90_025253 [Oedothorax gibbosus]|uniref:Rhabdovirus nucleocapsid domain-containing protein n=1 Tax=Oedothorax gibbosus TaxID=931172 RepID=A0AAV6U7V7_9ARAC|nr:hypothetical protein JTE90_025253 [Oedothorax gibbosus]